MSAAVAIARMELRLLRLPVAVAIFLGAVAGAVRYVWPPAIGRTGPELLVAYVGLVLMLTVERAYATQRCWDAFHGFAPLSRVGSGLIRLGVWIVGSAVLAAAGVLLIGHPQGDRSVLPRIALIGAWSLLGVAAAMLFARGEGEGRWSAHWLAIRLLSLGGVAELLATARPVLFDEAWQRGAADLLLWVPAHALVLASLAVASTSEKMPHQSPKAVRPRPKFFGMLRRRPPKVASRAAVTNAFTGGGDLAGLRPLFPIIWIVPAFLIAPVLDPRPGHFALGPLYLAVFALGLGVLLARAIARRARGWSLSRAYPVQSRAPWATLAVAWGVLVLGVVAAGVLTRSNGTVRILGVRDDMLGANWVRWNDTGPFEVPLRGPPWLPDANVGDRPAGMPRPHDNGFWPLRRGGVALADEPVYLSEALAYYLALAYGVKVDSVTLRGWFGEGLDVGVEQPVLTEQEYAEFLAPLHLLQWQIPRWYRQLSGGPFPPGSHADEAPPASVLIMNTEDGTTRKRRISTFPGVRDLVRRKTGRMLDFRNEVLGVEQRMQGRLRTAAAWRFLLDCSIFLLALLLFVRLFLLRTARRFVLPLLPLGALALWWSQRGATWRLATRDLWLAWPWLGLAVVGLCIAAWVYSIRRALHADRLALPS